MKAFTSISVLSTVVLSALARPAPQTTKSFTKQNGIDAINLNKQFQTLSADASCNAGDNACVDQQFAQCVSGKFVLTPCSSSLICAALPLVNSAGTSITCTTQSDVDTRIAATGATDADATGTGASSSSTTKKSTSTKTASSSSASATSASNTGDLQTSLCLDSSLVQTGFEKDGQETPAAGQVASITSSNNYINFCATTKLPLTNGAQVKGGSCNAAPMGIIASVDNMPSSKFVFPLNQDTIQANTAFTVKMAIRGLTTGNFVNAAANYFSGPQQIDDSGNIKGHSHIVIEKVNGMKDTTPTDPTKFAFFKGLNDAAEGGVLSAAVTDGLPEGTYRIASINSAANHQPVLVAVAQHGSLDDMVYFTVTSNGRQTNNNGSNSTSTSVAASASTTTKAKGSTKTTSSAVEEATTTASAASEETTTTASAASEETTTSSAKKSSKTTSADTEAATATATATTNQGSKDTGSDFNSDTSSKNSNTMMSHETTKSSSTSTMTHNAVQASSTASSDDSEEDCNN